MATYQIADDEVRVEQIGHAPEEAGPSVFAAKFTSYCGPAVKGYGATEDAAIIDLLRARRNLGGPTVC